MVVILTDDRYDSFLIGPAENGLPEDRGPAYNVVRALRKQGPPLSESRCRAYSFKFDTAGRIERDVEPAHHTLAHYGHREIVAGVVKEEHLKGDGMAFEIDEVHACLPGSAVDKLGDDAVTGIDDDVTVGFALVPLRQEFLVKTIAGV